MAEEKEPLLVSVVMITYGHEKFIREAVEGVLMQNTNFPVELIIADDCSPDKTETVVRDIEKNHKNGSWIQYTRHKENKGMMSNFTWALSRANGKYIALCEGDDYWTDPSKLKTQVEFMEKNKDCSFCFHQAHRLNHKSKLKEIFPKKIKKEKLSPIDFYKVSIATSSVLLKANLKESLTETLLKFQNHQHPDFIMYHLLLMNGKAGFKNENMSVYRIHVGGVSHNQYSESYLRKRILDLKLERDYFILKDKTVGRAVQKSLNSRILLYLRLFNPDNEHYKTIMSLGLKSISFYFALLHFIIFDKLKYKLKKCFNVSSKSTRG